MALTLTRSLIHRSPDAKVVDFCNALDGFRKAARIVEAVTSSRDQLEEQSALVARLDALASRRALDGDAALQGEEKAHEDDDGERAKGADDDDGAMVVDGVVSASKESM